MVWLDQMVYDPLLIYLLPYLLSLILYYYNGLMHHEYLDKISIYD